MEIKMNLVCSAAMRTLLDELQEKLVALAKKRFAGSKGELAPEYLAKRGELLEALREDINLIQTA